MFQYSHRVQFYETDLMGIVHHSNYLRFFEEARVAWAQAKMILEYSNTMTARALAVIETSCRHLRPCYFGDELVIDVQVRGEGARIFFQYRIFNKTKNFMAASGQTVHASVGEDMQLLRPSKAWKTILEKESWTEIWP